MKTKAAFTYDVRDIRLEEFALPAIEPKGMLLRVKMCGICGSDARMVFTGLTPRYRKPVILGHEFCGEVFAVGQDQTEFQIGELVTIAPIIPCMHCGPCLEGKDNLCENGRVVGCNDHGAMAEHYYVPEQMVAVGGAVKVPPGVPVEAAALSELVGCCLNGWEQTGLEPGDRVVIIGDGPIGLTFLQLARILGAGWIGIIGHRESRIQTAIRLGADEAYNADALALGAHPPQDVDRVIIATSNLAALDLAFQMTRKGGSILLFSGYVYGATYPLDLNQVHYREIHICSAIDCTIKQFRQAVKLLPKLQMEELISKTFSLDEIAQAFEGTRDRDVNKIALRP